MGGSLAQKFWVHQLIVAVLDISQLIVAVLDISPRYHEATALHDLRIF